MSANVPPAPYGYRLALLQTWGEHEEADHLLAMLNRIQRAFDKPDYTMPAPVATGLPDLVTCRADLALTEVHGDPLLGIAA